MTFRRTRKARGRIAAVAIAIGLVLSAAGCGGGDDGDDSKGATPSSKEEKDQGEGSAGGGQEDGGDGEPIAQVKGGKGGAFTLSITSAVRDGSGFATLKGTVANSGSTVVTLPGWQSDETELKSNGLSMAGATMVDRKAKKRYFILRDTNGRCLCTRFSSGFEQGKTTEWYAQFPAPPKSTNKVDFQVGDMPSASVELSGE